jgi:hypothetical protein
MSVLDALRCSSSVQNDGRGLLSTANTAIPEAYDHRSHDARNLIVSLVERVVVHPTEAKIILRPIQPDLTNPASKLEAQIVRVPLERRRPDRKEIISASTEMAGWKVNHALVLAVVRGRAWVRALRAREYAGTTEIARKYELSEPYVRRTLRLAFLAPDIVEAFAEGRQPRGLSLQQLLCPLPLGWSQQRRRFDIL